MSTNNKELVILIEFRIDVTDLDAIDFTQVLEELRGVGDARIADAEIVEKKKP